MQYALLYHETAAEAAKRADPAAADGYWAAWSHYIETLSKSGAMRGGNALQPAATGTTVRAGDGGRVVEDGPFADAREELGGFVIVEAQSIDEAIAFAEGAPCARPGAGRVEVRPVHTPSQ